MDSADLDFSQVEDDVQPQSAQLDPLPPGPGSKTVHKDPALGCDVYVDPTGRARTL